MEFGRNSARWSFLLKITSSSASGGKEDVKLDRESLIIKLYSKALEYTVNQKDEEELRGLIQGIKRSR
ncbi:MAG: hypothetical protein QXH67_00175 [Candidatus Bathyarchaeia archaeon]